MANRKQLIEEIFDSFRIVRHKISAQSAHTEQKNSITHSQWFVLCSIKNCNNSGIKSISEKLGISSSAATQIVDCLVQDGYVVRKDNPNDRRSVQLALSSKAVKQISDIRSGRIKEISKLFDALTDAELETYLRLNKKIA